LAIKLKGRMLASELVLASKEHADPQPYIQATVSFLRQYPANTSGSSKGTSDFPSREVLALTALRLGDALSSSAKSGASEQWRNALEYLAPLVEAAGTDPRVISLRAHALLRLGRTQEARALAESLEASAYRHPEWQADLSRRLAAAPDKSTGPTIIPP
jgi:hypothetical protein